MPIPSEPKPARPSNNTITDIGGVTVGMAQSISHGTGVTVILFDHPSITSVDARGGWPGTFDTDSVGPAKTFYRKHAIFLTGGDVFGLSCASGIQRFLVETKRASNNKPGDLPGVVGANIYDLDFGSQIYKVDYQKLGYEACANASPDPVKPGNFGAGMGATVGKLRGIKFATKGGVGSFCTTLDFGIKVGAIMVTNSLGNVVDEKGTTIGGTRRSASTSASLRRKYVELEELIPQYFRRKSRSRGRSKATTIGAVVTNLALTHEQTLKVAEMAHDGLARTVRPSHATTDGDTIFCASVANLDLEVNNDLLDVLGHVAATQVNYAILSAVRNAKKLRGIPSLE